MTLFLLLAGILAGVLLSAYFSGIETGYYSINKHRLNLSVRTRERRGRRVLAHLSKPAWLLAVILVGNNISVDLTSLLGQELIRSFLPDLPPELVNTLLLTPLLFLGGEILPKILFRAHAERLTYSLSFGISLTGVVLWPLVTIMRLPAALATRLSRGGGLLSSMAGREGLRALLGEGTRKKILDHVQGELAGRVMDLHRTPAGNVMCPLKVVSVLPEDMSRNEALERVWHRPFTRFPVHQRDQAGKIIGYVLLQDLIYDERKECQVRDHLRNLEILSEKMPADQALLLLQRSGLRLALVTSERGAGLGILSVTDLVKKMMQ